MVHLKVYVVPDVPLKVEVGLFTSPKLPPVPLTTLQLPVPSTGVLAASVSSVSPQVVPPV